MSKTIIKALIYDQSIQLVNLPLIASGSEGAIRIECDFDELWAGYGKTAVFYREKGEVYHVLLEGDAVTVPAEVLTDEGFFYFGIFGTAENTRTTEVLRVTVKQGAITTATAEPAEPTPNIYKQLMANYSRMDGRVNELVAMRGSGVTEQTISGDYFRGTIYSNGAAAFISVEFFDLPLTAGNFREDLCIPAAFAPLGLVTLSPLPGGQNATVTIRPRSWTGAEWAMIEITAGEDITEALEFEGYYHLESVYIPEVADIRVDYTGESHQTAGDAVRAQGARLWESIESFATQYFDKSIPKELGYIQQDGTLSLTGTYGTSYVTSAAFTLPAGTYTMYNTDDDTLDDPKTRMAVRCVSREDGSVQYMNEKTDKHTFTLKHESDVRIATYGIRWGSTVIIEGTEAAGYVDFKQAPLIKDTVLIDEKHPVELASIIKANVLYGKKYIAAGDSYTSWSDATYADGIYGGQNVTYDREIRLRNAMDGGNAGLSGSTMTYASGESIRSFSGSRYLEIPEDTDYLTIAFGINDSASRPLGALGDTENTSFYGAWDKVLRYYAENRPEMKIGIICFARANNAFYHAVKEIAKHYGIPLLDFYGGEDTPMYVDGKAHEVDASLASIKRSYWCGHAHSAGETETFRGKTYNMVGGSANEGHPGYRAHIDESAIIEAFLRRL